MKITNKLKERFCKDTNTPIGIFDEPYFTNRLKLYDKHFNTIEKWELFLELLENFENEQDYFEAYNKLKDTIINYLKETDGYQRFNSEDMNKYGVKNLNFPKNDIYKETFDNRVFVSVDMKKANFTALKHYDKSIVGDKDTYEEFMGMFTDELYFKQSKYIRQVVFGNLNPKRQTTYERYLMDLVLTDILVFTEKEKVVYFGTDEIVLDITDVTNKENYLKELENVLEKKVEQGINVRNEVFELRKIPNTSGYVKKFLNSTVLDFKCLDSYTLPFVLRVYRCEEVQEEDMVFMFNGQLAKLLEVPTIEVV